MHGIIETRNPDTIAAEINTIKRTTAKYVLQQSIEIGRLLVEAKEAVPYGNWGAWLEANCDYSTTNANNLMRIYTEYGNDSQLSFFEENKLELYGNLNRSQAIALLSLPKPEREEFVKANDVPSMSVSELEEKIKEAKAETEQRIRDEYADIEAEYQNKLGQAEARAKKQLADVNERLKAEQKKSTEAEEQLTSARCEADRLKKSSEELQQKLTEAEKKTVTIGDEERQNIVAQANFQTAERVAELEAEITRLKATSNITVSKCAVYFETIKTAYSSYRHTISDEADVEIKSKIERAFESLMNSISGGTI